MPATALGLEIKPLDTIVFIDPTGRNAGTLGLALEDVGYVVQPLLRLDRQIGQWMAKPEVERADPAGCGPGCLGQAAAT